MARTWFVVVSSVISVISVIAALAAPADAGAVGVRLPDGQLLGSMLQRGIDPAAVPGSLDRSLPSASRMSTAGQSKPAPNAGGDVAYNGGPVLHTSSPYLIFWDPSGLGITATSRQLLERYLTDVAAASGETTDTYGVARQYYDAAGYADAGQTFSAPSQAIADVDSYPSPDNDCVPAGTPFTACVTDAQVQTELHHLIGADRLPTDGPAGAAEFPPAAPVYLVVLPATVNVCQQQSACVSPSTGAFCAYHSAFLDGSVRVLYAVLPFGMFASGQTAKNCQPDGTGALQEPNGDEADIVAGDLSHELNETITDPLLTAWINSAPGGDGQELADNCEMYAPAPDPADGFSPDAYAPVLGGDPGGTLYDQLIDGDEYYTQSLWSNGQGACELQPAAAALTSAFAAPSSAAPGANVSFNPAASAAAAGFSSATWSFGDGSGQFTIGAPATVSHAFSAPGRYTVLLTVVDADGNVASASQTITVGTPPMAIFTASAQELAEGAPLSLDAGLSTDPNGVGITSYAWSFGDGQTGSGATASHTFSAPGVYPVSLVVTDALGLHSTPATTSIRVTAPLAVSFTARPSPALRSTRVLFDASRSSDPNSGARLTVYRWSFGDGSTGSGVTTSHAYARPGRYTARLAVTDSLGVITTVTASVVVVASERITRIAGHGRSLIVSVNAGGRITVGRVSRTLATAGRRTFTISLTRAQLRLRRRHRRVTLTLTVIYTPRAGPTIKRTVRVTLRG